MVRVMVCPLGTEVAGVNTRTGVTGLPETCVPRVMDVKAVIWASEVSIHINNKITQTIEDIVLHEWLTILVLLLIPVWRLSKASSQVLV